MRRARVGMFACSLLLAVACNGQIGDAISSAASGASLPSVGLPSVSLPSVGLPSVSVPTRTEEVATPTESEAPTEAPTTEAPTEAPTKSEAPTEAPTTEAPTEAPTTAPPTTEAPTTAPPTTEAPTEVPSPSPTPVKGKASTSTSATWWWILGILAVGGVILFLILRRRKPPATLQEAYAATAAVRDRLVVEASGPSATPGTIESLIDDADRRLRALQISPEEPATRSAVDRTLVALAEVREALALRASTAEGTHVSGSDVESRVLQAQAGLDAALGPLRAVSGGTASGFEG